MIVKMKELAANYFIYRSMFGDYIIQDHFSFLSDSDKAFDYYCYNEAEIDIEQLEDCLVDDYLAGRIKISKEISARCEAIRATVYGDE